VHQTYLILKNISNETLQHHLFIATFTNGPLHQQTLTVATGQVILEFIEVQGSVEIKHLYQSVPNCNSFKYVHR
jgi:hypothetical protein